MHNSLGWGCARVAAALVAVGLAASCDSGGGGGNSKPDVGDNDINQVVCIGDSITDGGCVPAGAPYPSRLAGMSGKKVANEGICGSTTETGVDRINFILSRYKPGYVCILYGINDIGFRRDTSEIINNLRRMVEAAKNNKTVVLLATLTPTYGEHAYERGGISHVNPEIRNLAKSEGVRLVDLEAEFGSDETLLQSDGLHPSDSGNQLIALAFNDKI